MIWFHLVYGRPRRSVSIMNEKHRRPRHNHPHEIARRMPNLSPGIPGNFRARARKTLGTSTRAKQASLPNGEEKALQFSNPSAVK